MWGGRGGGVNKEENMLGDDKDHIENMDYTILSDTLSEW